MFGAFHLIFVGNNAVKTIHPEPIYFHIETFSIWIQTFFKYIGKIQKKKKNIYSSKKSGSD